MAFPINKNKILWSLVVLAILTGIGLAIFTWFGQEDNPSFQSRLVLAGEGDGLGEAAQGFTRATGPVPFVFPIDYGPHPDYQTEWWYYTGNLTTPEGRHFGYQLTFFRRALLPPDDRNQRTSQWATDQAYMAHFALSDVQADNHYAFERIARGAAGIAGAKPDPYRVWLEDWNVELIEEDVYRLTANQEDISLDLILTDTKGPIPHGEQGYSQKGPDPGNASYYYSQTRFATEGSVTLEDKNYTVSGLTWKDHEYSTSALSDGQIGWDWFSIQLDNNTEIMLFQIRRDDGSIDPFSSGSIILSDGEVINLLDSDFEIRVLDTWRSPHTNANYPAKWEINIPSQSIRLEIQPHIPDQEMNLSYSYWEGAVKVSGDFTGLNVNGNGYVELTGYAGSMSGEF